MTFRCFDSIFPANLPPGADAYIGYTSGYWPTYTTLVRLFPHAHIISMAVEADDDAEGCDCENRDLTIEQVPGWIRRQQARGVYRPIVYAGAANMGAVQYVVRNTGIARSAVRYLSAHYTYQPHICGPDSCAYPGVGQCDGTQWSDAAAGLHGSLIDESLLAAGFFAGPAPPKPKPKPAPPVQEDDMTLMLDSAQGPYPLTIPFGTGQMRFLCAGATQEAPVKATVTWLDEGASPVPEVLDWGAGDKTITVQPKHDEARLDVLEGAGPWISVTFDPRKT